jgi:beta-glucuronidase
MLFPRKSATRDVRDLGGPWNFKVDWKNEGRKQKWFTRALRSPKKIPVPCSYNDYFKDAAIRDHIGDVWYERSFLVPASWRGRRIVVRFGSATHHARVWVNGRAVGAHKGGFLPFECDVSRSVRFGKRNRLTVVVNNVLDWSTLPPGEVRRAPEGGKTQEYWFDFFNYAGLHRPVKLMAMPRTYIDAIQLATQIRGRTGVVTYNVRVKGPLGSTSVSCFDRRGKMVIGLQGAFGTLRIRRAHLWAPGKPYLYSLEVSVWDQRDELLDRYRLPFGIRTVRVNRKKFLINGKPFYFKGFATHEDSEKRGKGLDEALNRRDAAIWKKMGANSFRTSHYPYSEEWLNLADEKGIAVIGEAPAVGMNFLGPEEKVFTLKRVGADALKHHFEVLRAMIGRDRNHPCVVMWSVANEPASQERRSRFYFERVARETRRIDSTRPITLVTCAESGKDRVMRFFDVLCVNRYYGWYVHSGRLEGIESDLAADLKRWHQRFRKPVFLTEFGADALPGVYQDPPVMWSEEYQREVIRRCCRALDGLDFVIGEHIWNFADFATKQSLFRPAARNYKGVFTRNRRPKLAVDFLRERWSK